MRLSSRQGRELFSERVVPLVTMAHCDRPTAVPAEGRVCWWYPRRVGPVLAMRALGAACLQYNIWSNMAGIKQNGILGQLLRDSWLVFAENLA